MVVKAKADIPVWKAVAAAKANAAFLCCHWSVAGSLEAAVPHDETSISNEFVGFRPLGVFG